MKLTTFDAENMVSQRKGDAMISVSRKGASSVSKAAALRMSWGGGDLISFHQDDETPEDWYISLSKSGFILRDDKGGGGLAFNNTAMANAFLDALGVEEDRAAFFIASEPIIENKVKYWAVMTSKPIIKKRKSKK